ncbi:putative bifunctional diguanylate cyclase/phosphodiesterase [Jiella sp. M17.18]|uniref:putative bifunctional diguanylate cyclase/phosphodiesterase n=1 Tax=Jiella sp. M17.18 TaxID=3234247 RepID=UPI0034DE6E09
MTSILVAVAIFLALVLLLRLRERVRAKLDEWELLRKREALLLRRDELTGALNRSAFIADCAMRLRRADFRHALLLHIDLDYLKQINDGQGHDAGDAALRQLGLVVRRCCPGALFGRLGGDEFALLLEADPLPDSAVVTAQLFGDLAQPVWHKGRQLKLSASIGVVKVAAGDGDVDEAMKRADLALYESKRNGRAQATVFRREMMVDYKHLRFMERELRAAILLNELELDYQPIFERDAAIRGWEALVRWRHPVRGRIPPNDFIPIAEQSLLIDMLGEWVLRRACLDFRDIPERLVGVNFSASQFKRDDVVAMVQRVLGETGMPASRLVIEVTESVALNLHEDIIRRLQALRAMGVRISLDDFGAGFCGFAYLRSFPIDSIKIDRAFVAKLGTTEADDVMLTALSSVARAMGVSVLAEGIETEEQLVLAKAAGCDFFQGYHLGRPQPVDAAQSAASAMTADNDPGQNQLSA